MAMGFDPRFLAENSSIRGRGWGWVKINPHIDLNGSKLIPVGDGGGGDGCAVSVPVFRNLSVICETNLLSLVSS